MKRIIFIILNIILITNVSALEFKDVYLENCSSVDNIFFNADGETIRVGLLAYDSMDGYLNKEIENYVCNKLKNANELKLVFDEKNQEKDEYNRHLMWIYVDNKLLQEELISLGYGQVNYVKDEYKYLDKLCEKESYAIKNSLGIWNYDDIEEAFCDSDYITSKKEEEEKKEELKNTNPDLKKILFINSLIILLIVVLLLKRG